MFDSYLDSLNKKSQEQMKAEQQQKNINRIMTIGFNLQAHSNDAVVAQAWPQTVIKSKHVATLMLSILQA